MITAFSLPYAIIIKITREGGFLVIDLSVPNASKSIQIYNDSTQNTITIDISKIPSGWASNEEMDKEKLRSTLRTALVSFFDGYFKLYLDQLDEMLEEAIKEE